MNNLELLNKKRLEDGIILHRYESICPICNIGGVRRGRKFCSMKCMGIERKGRETWMKHRKHKEESKTKNSLSNMGRIPWNKNKHNLNYSGNKHHWWKGGVTELSVMIRESLENELLKREALKRDNYTCQGCGKRGGHLEVHHIIPFSHLIEKYGIVSLEMALQTKQLWDINNCITLCLECHKKTDTFPKNLRYATVRTYKKQIVRVNQKCINPAPSGATKRS